MDNTETTQNNVSKDSSQGALVIIVVFVMALLAVVLAVFLFMRTDKVENSDNPQDQSQVQQEDEPEDSVTEEDLLDIADSEPDKAIDDTIEQLDQMIEELDGEDIEDGSGIVME